MPEDLDVIAASHQDPTALLGRGPDAGPPRPAGACARLLRHLVARALGPRRDQQQQIDKLLLSRLESLERRAQDHHDALASLLSGLDAVTTTLRDRSVAVDNLAFDLTAAVAGWDRREHGDEQLQARLETWRATLGRRLRRDGPPARRVVVPACVRLDTEVGSLLYPANDEVVTPWVAVHRHWEREETSFLESSLRPGMRFIDVGAHVGYLTFAAARAVGPSGCGIALEPAPANFALLYANLLQAGVANVEAINAAAWRRSGYVDLELSVQNSGDHRVVEHEGDGGGEDDTDRSVTVTAVALDDLLPPDARIDVVKVDTQGRDHMAVAGMSAMIGRSRPLLLVEFWPEGIADLGDEAGGVLDFYRSLDLHLEVLGAPQVDGTSNAALVDAALATPGAFCTLVLTPVEKPSCS